MPEGSPTRAGPEPAGIAEGSRARPTPPRDSIMNDGRWAERLISQIIMPEIQEELSHLGAATLFREAYAALVRAGLDAEEAQARAEAAERALEAARTDRAAKIAKAARRADVEANRARVALNQLWEAESLVEACNIHIAKLDSAIRTAEARAEHAEERVERAEEKEREATSLAAEREAEVQEVKAAAEVRVARAMEEFRASESFADELAETSVDAYL